MRRPRAPVLVVLGVVCLWLCTYAPLAHAKSFTSALTGQRDVLVVIDDVKVQTQLQSEVDGGRPWCQAEPTIFYMLRQVTVGNPRRHVDFSVSTQSPFLVFPDRDVAVSQTVRTPSVSIGSCSSGVHGTELLYTGTGTTRHSMVALTGTVPTINGEPLPLPMPPAYRFAGVLGLGLDPRADEGTASQRILDTRGVWARTGTAAGWSNASMYFGNRHTLGWILFNTTHAHPYSYRHPAAMHVRARARAEDGFHLRSPVTLRIGDRSWERSAVFLPELPFIEVPEDIYDAAIMPLGIRVHARSTVEGLRDTSWFQHILSTVTLDVDAEGPIAPVAIHADSIVVHHSVGDLDDDARYLLFRRAPPGESRIRFGCAPFRFNVFLDATQADPQSPPVNGSDTTQYPLRLSLAVVEDVERTHTFNILMFPVLVTLMVVYTMGTALTQNVMTQEVEEPTHSLLLELHHGWNMEAAELCGAVCAFITMYVNHPSLDLVPRYAYLMDSDLDTAVTFATLARWIVYILAPLHVTVVLLEVAILYLSRRKTNAARFQKGARADSSRPVSRTLYPLRSRSTRRLRNTPGGSADTGGAGARVKASVEAALVHPVARVLSIAVAPLASLTHTVSGNDVVIGTLRMWNFHLIVRRMCMQFGVIVAMAITVMEGPRKGYNVRILAFVVIIAFIVPCRMMVGLANALLRDVANRGPNPRARTGIRLQVLVYTLTTVAFVAFDVVYLVEPLSTMIFPVFPTSILWAISATTALLLLSIGVATQLDRARGHTTAAGGKTLSKRPPDPIDTMKV